MRTAQGPRPLRAIAPAAARSSSVDRRFPTGTIFRRPLDFDGRDPATARPVTLRVTAAGRSSPAGPLEVEPETYPSIRPCYSSSRLRLFARLPGEGEAAVFQAAAGARVRKIDDPVQLFATGGVRLRTMPNVTSSAHGGLGGPPAQASGPRISHASTNLSAWARIRSCGLRA